MRGLMQQPIFRDRRDAGRALAQALAAAGPWEHPVVLALPRGGVPVAYEVAQALDAELDILVVRKIGHPRHEEYAIGAIAAGGIMIMNEEARGMPGSPTSAEVERIVEREREELQRREALYRGQSAGAQVDGRDAIVVDDGLATGATMRAAVQALRRMGPRRVIVAVPVAASSSCEDLRRLADEVVCVRTPEPFFAVGAWYADFPQTSDEEVRELLQSAHQRAG